MTTEENKRMEALAYIIADLKTENIEMTQRVHQLMDDYNEVVRQLNGKEKHKDEDPSRQTLDETLKMREHCDKLELENVEKNRFIKAIESFVKEKNIYMMEGASCGYRQGPPAICSTTCLKCDSCLSVIEGFGVICQQALLGLNIRPVRR